MQKGYKTLAGPGGAEIEEKRSRFIAAAAALSSEEAALAFIEAQRAKHKTASHHVYAYCLRENNGMRYSDDGEPQGTAGMPVLDVLRHNGITDAAIVVTRYFGGTLLGTGGLARAYSDAATAAVAAAGCAEMMACSTYYLQCAYSQYENLKHLITQMQARITGTSYGSNVSLQFSVKSDEAARLIAAIQENTGGTCDAQYQFERFEALEEK